MVVFIVANTKLTAVLVWLLATVIYRFNGRFNIKIYEKLIL